MLRRKRGSGWNRGRIERRARLRAPDRTSRPGDHRTAHSATAGTAPVPSHIAISGGAVALGAERRSLIARYAWPEFRCGVGKIRTTIDTLKLKMRLAIAISN